MIRCIFSVFYFYYCYYFHNMDTVNLTFNLHIWHLIKFSFMSGNTLITYYRQYCFYIEYNI